jgi:hypothetical protein
MYEYLPGSVEKRLEDLDRHSNQLQKSAIALAAIAARVNAAAKTGFLQDLRKSLEQLKTGSNHVADFTRSSLESWPADHDDVVAFGAEYEAEVMRVATAAGFNVRRHEGGLIVYPFLVSLLPKERAVFVDGRRVPGIRPRFVVDYITDLKTKQKPKQSDRLLEALFGAYSRIVGPDGVGRLASLSEVYSVLTLLPGTAAAYGETEFVRDIYLIDRNGPRATKDGWELELPASTGTKNKRSTYSFVGPEGERVEYFAIKFTRLSNAPAADS